MDSLNHPSSPPFNLPSMPALSSSFPDHSCAKQLAQAASTDLSSIFHYLFSPASAATSDCELDHIVLSCQPKEGWARILDEISRGANPMQIIEDCNDASVVINASHGGADVNDILNLLGMRDNSHRETPLGSEPRRSELSASALDCEYSGVDLFDDKQAQAKGRSWCINSSSSVEEWRSAACIHSNLKAEQRRIASQGARASWQQQACLAGQQARASWQVDETSTSCQQRGTRSSAAALHLRCIDRQAASQNVNANQGAGDSISKALASDIEALKGSLHSNIKANWAGPTLRDIEAALAHDTKNIMSADPLNIVHSSAPSVALSCESSSTHIHTLHLGKPHHHPELAIHTHPLDVAQSLQLPLELLPACSQEPPVNQQIKLDGSWRDRLQKRNRLEPKQTKKVKSEEEAMADGYRWRKYGQKAIKNYPFPRSYYRCTSGKCTAKKQVERCEGDEALFSVTYEGMHLHHRPNYLRKLRMKFEYEDNNKQKSSIMSSPTSSTHGSSYVDNTNIEPLSSSSMPTSPLSQSPTLDASLNFGNSFSRSPSPQSLHPDTPLDIGALSSLRFLFE